MNYVQSKNVGDMNFNDHNTRIELEKLKDIDYNSVSIESKSFTLNPYQAKI